ncbi:MAG: glycosyltransferase family 4 protein [Syntrophorhabdus aromaticivorans]|jgi:glycosyltransferase involved in cell wall biosynthesis|uniref:Glycosyltransferase family 4 protein n=1 Tax=Syntrophorhabdus aromaticivorans TaxID=328301 RepID=A0A971M6B2_9BACT|nr:glycosyltransferase family 4 protein [Syntrophorhabdus aromaticivorans]
MMIGRYRMRKGHNYCFGVFDEQLSGQNDFIRELRKLEAATINLGRSVFSFRETVTALHRFARELDVALVCSNDYKSNVFGLVLGRQAKLPAIAVFHGRTSKDAKVRFYERLDDIFLKYFDSVVAVSEYSRKQLQSIGVDSQKIHVIPNAVDEPSSSAAEESQSLRKEFGLTSRNNVILFVGRLSREKGLQSLVESAAMLIRKHEDARFILVGEGPERANLTRLIARYGLEGHVTMTGYRHDVRGFIEISDFLVLPSVREGMPVVILEAFREGKAVVATGVGGVPEFVMHNVNGLIVKPGDTHELTESLSFMLMNQDKALVMGRHGKALIREKYNFAVQAQEYGHLYDDVLSGFQRH